MLCLISFSHFFMVPLSIQVESNLGLQSMRDDLLCHNHSYPPLQHSANVPEINRIKHSITNSNVFSKNLHCMSALVISSYVFWAQPELVWWKH